MKVLTLHQPWASLIALGVKTIETRSWRAPQSLIGERIAVHAGTTYKTLHLNIADRDHLWSSGSQMLIEPKAGNEETWKHGNPFHPTPLGVIVATAVLAECLPIDGPNESGHLEFLCPDIYGGLTLLRFGDGGWRPATVDLDLADQLPYGDFTDGRFAWLLKDIQELVEPIPFMGGQGLTKTWEPA